MGDFEGGVVVGGGAAIRRDRAEARAEDRDGAGAAVDAADRFGVAAVGDGLVAIGVGGRGADAQRAVVVGARGGAGVVKAEGGVILGDGERNRVAR